MLIWPPTHGLKQMKLVEPFKAWEKIEFFLSRKRKKNERITGDDGLL